MLDGAQTLPPLSCEGSGSETRAYDVDEVDTAWFVETPSPAAHFIVILASQCNNSIRDDIRQNIWDRTAFENEPPMRSCYFIGSDPDESASHVASRVAAS